MAAKKKSARNAHPVTPNADAPPAAVEPVASEFPVVGMAASAGGLRQLEQVPAYIQLLRTEDLESSIDELESSNEELKAAHEEAMSMNEEFQSANEELETSKEELQSLNEELGTVNSQLQDKVEELEAVNNDMANLLRSTEIALLFLDPSLRIKSFTPAATSLLNLIKSDVGRPFGDIAPKFSDEQLLDDARRVLRTLIPVEKEVRSQDGRWYLRRVMPYRTGRMGLADVAKGTGGTSDGSCPTAPRTIGSTASTSRLRTSRA